MNQNPSLLSEFKDAKHKMYFTDGNYSLLSIAILNATYPHRVEHHGGWDMITLEDDPIKNVTIRVRVWEDGCWAVGGTDEYGRKERIWEPTRSHYEVDSFEAYNEDGFDVPSDFDKSKLELILNQYGNDKRYY